MPRLSRDESSIHETRRFFSSTVTTSMTHWALSNVETARKCCSYLSITSFKCLEMDRDLRSSGVASKFAECQSNYRVAERRRDFGARNRRPSRNRKRRGKRSKLSRSRSCEAASPFHRAVSRFEH